MPPPALVFGLALLCGLLMGGQVEAQDEPPPIGRFVIDLRGTFPGFPGEVQLADSRGLTLAELPGRGLGVDAGAHVYVFTWKVVTFGLGAQITRARARRAPPDASGLRHVTENFTAVAPQLSFNFGTGNGWSYLSGGLGSSRWSLVPDGAAEAPGDRERLKTLNYGGGARWFIKRHVAFTFDVRFYAIDPGTGQFGYPGSPRVTFVIMGAGVSIK